MSTGRAEGRRARARGWAAPPLGPAGAAVPPPPRPPPASSAGSGGPALPWAVGCSNSPPRSVTRRSGRAVAVWGRSRARRSAFAVCLPASGRAPLDIPSTRGSLTPHGRCFYSRCFGKCERGVSYVAATSAPCSKLREGRELSWVLRGAPRGCRARPARPGPAGRSRRRARASPGPPGRCSGEKTAPNWIIRRDGNTRTGVSGILFGLKRYRKYCRRLPFI